MIFRKKSLTADIERDVHDYVRSLHPVQYVGFRLATFLSRVFMVCAFGLILAMGVISAFLSREIPADSPEMQQLTQQMSQYIFGTIVGLVFFEILGQGFYSQLMAAVSKIKLTLKTD